MPVQPTFSESSQKRPPKVHLAAPELHLQVGNELLRQGLPAPSARAALRSLGSTGSPALLPSLTEAGWLPLLRQQLSFKCLLPCLLYLYRVLSVHTMQTSKHRPFKYLEGNGANQLMEQFQVTLNFKKTEIR